MSIQRSPEGACASTPQGQAALALVSTEYREDVGALGERSLRGFRARRTGRLHTAVLGEA